MKKIVCLVGVVLMIAAVAIAAQKMVITEKNLPGLKGTWQGVLSFGVFDQGTSPAKLEILNDTVPVKAKLSIADVPAQIANQIGVVSGPNSIESDNGAVTTGGTILFIGQSPKNFFEISHSSEKKIKIWYYFQGMRGEGIFKKK